jgi:AraC family transcriptional regulator
MPRTPKGHARERLLAEVARELPAFQDATYAVDEAAAAVLALGRNELRCLDHLRDAPLGERELAARTDLPQADVSEAIRRLELAGYAQRVLSGSAVRYQMTHYALEWIGELWEPLRHEGSALLEGFRTSELAVLLPFMRQARELQLSHALRIRKLLAEPAHARRPNRRRGGLSPAALQRVQLYVQAHLDRPVPLRDLAERAGLSAYHFARAFKVTTGETPRAFVERLRIARAEALMRDGALTLAQVALATGFATQSSFTNAFRRATGFTPARYLRDAPPPAPAG